MMEVEKGGFFMKCPHCGVHYDDGDKECPMCGARRPMFQSDPSQLARAAGRLARPHPKGEETSWVGEHVTKTCAHPKKKACPHTQALDGRPQPAKKKGNKAFWIAILIFALINIRPALVGALEDIVYQIRWMQTQEQAREWQADSPLPGWDGDGIRMEDAIPCAGVWGIAETRAQAIFSRVLDNEYGLEQYEVTADGYRERGVYYYYINNDADAQFPDDFPQDQYIWYKLVVTPAEITGTAPNPQADMESYQSWGATVDVFQSPDCSETYFRQWDTPWLPADSAVYAQNAGGADEADALLGSGFRNL